MIEAKVTKEQTFMIRVSVLNRKGGLIMGRNIGGLEDQDDDTANKSRAQECMGACEYSVMHGAR